MTGSTLSIILLIEQTPAVSNSIAVSLFLRVLSSGHFYRLNEGAVLFYEFHLTVRSS